MKPLFSVMINALVMHGDSGSLLVSIIDGDSNECFILAQTPCGGTTFFGEEGLPCYCSSPHNGRAGIQEIYHAGIRKDQEDARAGFLDDYPFDKDDENITRNWVICNIN